MTSERNVSSERVSPLTVEEIVERLAWKLCAMENEVWDEAPASYHERYRREAAQMLSSKRIDQSIDGLFLALRSSVKTVWQSAFNAALDCPHEIEFAKVVLKVDREKHGNALAQLHARLSTIEAPAAPSEVTEAMVERFRAFVKEATGTELSLQIVERALTAALKGGR